MTCLNLFPPQLVAGAKGENVYDAINQELGAVATEDLRNLVKEKVAPFLTSPAEPVVEEPVVKNPVVEEPVVEEYPGSGYEGDPLTEAQGEFEKIDAPPH